VQLPVFVGVLSSELTAKGGTVLIALVELLGSEESVHNERFSYTEMVQKGCWCEANMGVKLGLTH